MHAERLERLFNPKTIAVIGASSRKGSVGYSVFRNIIGSEYEGIVYPINPKRESVQGVRSYPSVTKVPDTIDLAVVATPAKTVPGIIDECAKAGVGSVIILSSGFAEIGSEGEAMSQEILRTARKSGMRVMGPNCLGYIRPTKHLNVSFAGKMALPGKIAFISQSGALCTAILDWSVKQNVGFSYFASIGSMLDIGFHDLIDYFGSDPETSSIVLYMESITNARKFMSAARAFARTKPIVVLKAGRSSEGAKAARSHTGSIAGNDAVFDAAFKRAGIVRVNEIGELFDCAQTLSMQKRPAGNRLAIVTNAGGPGVISTDALMEMGGQIAALSPDTINKLDQILPPAWSRSNPVDVLGDADPERYRKAVEVCIDDMNVDGVLVILTPQAMTDPKGTADGIVSLPNMGKKTILAAWMGEDDVREGRTVLEKGSIPVYRTPENGVKSFMHLYAYTRNIQLLYETPATIPHAFVPKTDENRHIVNRVLKEGRNVLTEDEANAMLSNYQIPVTRHAVASTAEKASAKAAEIGYPVVMKVLSPDILHKTDIGGVALNIANDEQARNAFRDIMSSVKAKAPKADVKGVLVQEMVRKRYELLIGCQKDPIFGPAIVFGMGGVAVEVFRDTNIGLPPLNMALSMRVIEETKIFELLKGFRGIRGVDLSAIQFLLYKFAYLVSDFPEIKEVDINPFAVDEEGGVVLDAKIILEEKASAQEAKPYSHMVISPYPKEYVASFRMSDGRDVTLRPIRPEDEPMEAEMFTRFSERTQRFRFFRPIREITHDLLVRYTQIDYDREIAIIAEIEEEGRKKMAGVARIISDPYNEVAEFAVVVADPWQQKGLGNKLTDYTLEIAERRGIRKVYANFLRENQIMKHIFVKRGFRLKEENGDCYYAEKALGAGKKAAARRKLLLKHSGHPNDW